MQPTREKTEYRLGTGEKRRPWRGSVGDGPKHRDTGKRLQPRKKEPQVEKIQKKGSTKGLRQQCVRKTENNAAAGTDKRFPRCLCATRKKADTRWFASQTMALQPGILLSHTLLLGVFSGLQGTGEAADRLLRESTSHSEDRRDPAQQMTHLSSLELPPCRSNRTSDKDNPYARDESVFLRSISKAGKLHYRSEAGVWETTEDWTGMYYVSGGFAEFSVSFLSSSK